MPAEKRQPAGQAGPTRGVSLPRGCESATGPSGAVAARSPLGAGAGGDGGGHGTQKGGDDTRHGQARGTGTWTGAPRVRTDSGQPTDY